MDDQRQSCLIHYESIFTSEQLTTLSQNALDTLVECKRIREGLGGVNSHETQCKNIPENCDKKNTSITENVIKNSLTPKHY